MTNSSLINDAADLIADYDPACAQAFRAKPFQRQALAKAFRAGFLSHSTNTLNVCDIIDRVVALDILSRHLAA